jgi:F-type H+-transporting ATPase subunit delta
MEQLVGRSGYTTIVAKLLVLLADRDRLVLLKDIAAIFHDLLAERQNVVRAEIVSAEPLSPQRAAAIEQRLAAVTGKKVSMTTTVDKDLLGGVVARVGSTVYDASIATQLKKMKDRLNVG